MRYTPQERLHGDDRYMNGVSFCHGTRAKGIFAAFVARHANVSIHQHAKTHGMAALCGKVEIAAHD